MKTNWKTTLNFRLITMQLHTFESLKEAFDGKRFEFNDQIKTWLDTRSILEQC